METTPKKTMPFKYFVMWAGIWFLASTALGLSQVEGKTVVYVQAVLLTGALLTMFVGAIMQSGWKVGLILPAVGVAGVVIIFLWRDRPLASTMDLAAWSLSMSFAISLLILSWSAGGVEWQILKDSALPALVIVLAFSYFYLAYERNGRIGPLTSSVIWFVAATAWLGSAVITARRLL